MTGIRSIKVRWKDFAAGMIFVVIGLFFAIYALVALRFGEAVAMGPAYFPTVLGFILAGFGVFIAATSIGKPDEPFGAVSWRGVVLVTGSIIFFAATIRGLGMAPALGLSIFMAAMSSGKMTLRGAAFLSGVLTAFCVAVFIYALGLPYPVIGPWIVE